ELGRELHREIARLFAAQNAIDIGGGTTPVVCSVESVGEQTAVPGPDRIRIDRRYLVSGRRQYDRHAMRDREHIRRGDKAASRLASKGDDGLFDFQVVMNRRTN